MARDPKCRKCGLWKGNKNVCVWGDGPEDATVVAIGEAPGAEEDKRGRPFVGRSGSLLRGELEDAELPAVYITNIVKCRPPDNRDPTPEEIKACRPYLEEELAQIKPEYVLTLGKPATKEILKKAKITEVQGKLIPFPGNPKITGIPCFHPAYVLRDMSKLPFFRKTLSILKSTIAGEVRGQEVKYEVLTSETLRRFVAEFQAADEFSFDLETAGLFPYTPEKVTITSVNIGIYVDGFAKAWIIPMHMMTSPRLFDKQAQTNLMWLIYRLSKGKKAIGHNGKFDNAWLYNQYGFRFHLDFDTMLAHHVLDENNLHDLETLSRQFLDAEDYDIPLSEKQWPTDIPKFLEYTGKDAVYTLRLKGIFYKMLCKDPKLRALFYRLVMPASRALCEIEQVGIPWNMEQFKIKGAELLRERNDLKDKLDGLIKEALGPPEKGKARKALNWNSPQQVAKFLYDDLGIKCVVFTDKGGRSTGEAAVIELKGKHPVVDALLEYREKAKFHATYFEGFEPLIVDGRLHISYKIHGTVTGRYSSRLHSIPRDDSVRSLGTAPEGWDFAQGDLSQAELRIASELSGDLELRRCFLPGGPDVHWSTLLYTIGSGASGEYVQPAIDAARKIAIDRRSRPQSELSLADALEILKVAGHEAAIGVDKLWKEARKRAKAINFGFIYGMYEKKFIETCKIKYGFEPTFEEATAFRTAYFELYRGIPTWHDSVKSQLALDGFVRSLSGRLRRLPGVHSGDKALRMEAERQAINSPVQGVIGDIKAMAMVEIHETVDRKWLRVIGEHHDAILMQIRRATTPEEIKYRDGILRQVKAIMRKPRILGELGCTLSVPLESELEIGDWSKGKTWKDPLEQHQ